MNDENTTTAEHVQPKKMRETWCCVVFDKPALTRAARRMFLNNGFKFGLAPWRKPKDNPVEMGALVTVVTDLDEAAVIRKVEEIAAAFGGRYDNECNSFDVETGEYIPPPSSTQH